MTGVAVYSPHVSEPEKGSPPLGSVLACGHRRCPLVLAEYDSPHKVTDFQSVRHTLRLSGDRCASIPPTLPVSLTERQNTPIPQRCP